MPHKFLQYSMFSVHIMTIFQLFLNAVTSAYCNGLTTWFCKLYFWTRNFYFSLYSVWVRVSISFFTSEASNNNTWLQQQEWNKKKMRAICRQLLLLLSNVCVCVWVCFTTSANSFKMNELLKLHSKRYNVLMQCNLPFAKCVLLFQKVNLPASCRCTSFTKCWITKEINNWEHTQKIYMEEMQSEWKIRFAISFSSACVVHQESKLNLMKKVFFLIRLFNWVESQAIDVDIFDYTESSKKCSSVGFGGPLNQTEKHTVI